MVNEHNGGGGYDPSFGGGVGPGGIPFGDDSRDSGGSDDPGGDGGQGDYDPGQHSQDSGGWPSWLGWWPAFLSLLVTEDKGNQGKREGASSSGGPRRRGFYSGHMSYGRVHVDSGDLEYAIDESYRGVGAVTLKTISNGITLALSDDGKVYVSGFISREPEIRAGRLFIDGLRGILKLPKNKESLTLEANLTSGDVRGAIAHSGRIATVSGGINLELYAPLALEASVVNGEVSVIGMMSEGRGVYSPPNAQPKGKLSLQTTSGDINVRYML
ncbi:DUF4097 family beta strand repeat protein [Candidatus Woesearchaeota archaeon]|nr:DUF4097 family beta strand repeat protein [Candidatus Woesearchaeota archaeon]